MATVAQAATPGTNHVIGCPCIYCAEIQRLTAERDSLAAGNRRMREALEGVCSNKQCRCQIKEPKGVPLYCAGCWEQYQRGLTVLRQLPHGSREVAREVARVKALERIAQSERAMCERGDDGYCRRHTVDEEAALEEVRKWVMYR